MVDDFVDTANSGVGVGSWRPYPTRGAPRSLSRRPRASFALLAWLRKTTYWVASWGTTAIHTAVRARKERSGEALSLTCFDERTSLMCFFVHRNKTKQAPLSLRHCWSTLKNTNSRQTRCLISPDRSLRRDFIRHVMRPISVNSLMLNSDLCWNYRHYYGCSVPPTGSGKGAWRAWYDHRIRQR